MRETVFLFHQTPRNPRNTRHMNSIEKFLAAKTYAVAGASNRQHKYGNKVFRALLAAGRETYPLNPAQDEIEGHQAYPSIADLPLVPEALSIITPPEVTRKVVADAIAAGVQHIESRRQFPNFSRSRSDLAATAAPHAPTSTPPASPDPPAIPNPAYRLPSKRNQTHRAEQNDSYQGYLCKRREWIPGKWRPRPDLWKVSTAVGFK